VDALDFLEAGQPDTYAVSFWLYATTKGVWARGGRLNSLDQAEASLQKWAGLPLVFERRVVGEEVSAFASHAYKHRMNIAVVLDRRGNIVSQALLPSDFRGTL